MATTGTQLTSVAQLAGSWSGWHTYNGISFRVNVAINTDGRVTLAFANNPAMYYFLFLEDGKLRFGQDPKKPGYPAQFFEEGRRQYLTFLGSNGSVWVECQRNR